MDFPTLGLNFDLNDLVAGLRKLRDAKAEFLATGKAADKAGDQIEAAGKQAAGAAAAVEGAAQRGSRAHNAEETAIKAKMRALRDLERAMRDIDRVEKFQKRMNPAVQQETAQRDKAKRGLMSYILALLGLGTAYDAAGRKQANFLSGLGMFGNALRQMRLRAFDLRFALAALFGALTLGPLAAMADQMVALESRTRLYAKTASDVPRILEETFAVAQRSRAGLEGVATLYTRLAPLGDSLGRSQAQLLRVVETVSKAFSIGGAAASEATAGAQQFAQALSSNRFGGDELRSVAENAPVLLAALADGVNQINPALNLNAATFIKWAQAGNANSEIMVRALEYASTKINTMFASTTPTISQATVVIKNALTKMVDEVDRRSGEAGMRLSTNIAMGMQEFAEFLTKDSTIDAMIATVNGIKVAFDLVGMAIKGVITYMPAIIASVAAFTVAMNSALIATTLAGAIRAVGTAAVAASIQFTAAGGGLALFSGAAGVASGAVVTLGTALRGLAGVVFGPIGAAVAIASLAFGLNNFVATSLTAQEAGDKFTDSQERGISALQRAVTLFQTYGGTSEESKKHLEAFNKTINDMIGLTDDQTRGLDAAGQAALQRAKMEQQLTVALLRRAAAESLLAGAQLSRSASNNEIRAGANRIAAATELIPSKRREAQANIGRYSDQAAFERRLAERLIGSAEPLSNAADAAERMKLEVPEIENGSGISNLGGADDKKGGKGMAGAINAIARLRAEVAGLNDQIDALNTNPLSDVAARIIAAGREAAAARTAGKGAGFADEAQRLAMLKEEATIRLDLTKALVDQQAAAERAGQSDFYGAMYDADARAAMMAYYQGGQRSSAAFAAALYAQAGATAQAEKEQANLEIAQKFGATSVGEIADAYRAAMDDAGLLTDQTSAYADELQRQAQVTYEAVAAAIELAEARERAAKVGNARLAYAAETDDLIQYATALWEGAAALDAYNRRKREQDIIASEGPAAGPVGNILQPLFAMLQDVNRQEASYTVEYERRSAEMREQLRLAGMTTREREVEAEAMELAAAAGRKLATDADRAAAKMLIVGREAADLAITVSDSIRQGFIQSGDLSFDSLKEALAKSIRQTLYDELIAKPVDLVVKAVLEFEQKGLEAIMSYIKKMLGGSADGSMTDALGTFFGESGKFGNFMSRFGETGSKLASSIGSLAAAAPQLYAAYEASKMLTSAGGSLIGLSSAKQANADKAASFGVGPVAALLYGLFADTKRALAITAVEVIGGAFRSKGTQAYDGGPFGEIDAAGKQLATAMNKLVREFGLSLATAQGLYAVFGFTAGENPKKLGGEGFFGGMLNQINSLGGMSLDQIKGSALGKGVDFSQVKDPEQAIDRIMRELVIRVGEAQVVPFTEAEKALIRAAESLEEAAATLKAARNVESDIQRALLQFTNPREFAIQNLRDQQLQRRQGILDLVGQGLISDDRRPGIETMLRELERAELADTLSKFADGLNGAISSLEDLKNAQQRLADYAQGLITGNLSPLSPAAMLAASQTEFQRLLAAASGGDAQAMEKLTNASTDYLSAAQRYFASSPQYASIFEEVYNQLVALSTKDFEDPLIGVIETEVQRLIDAINAGFLLISGEPPATVIPDVPVVPGLPGTGGDAGTGYGGGGSGGGGDSPGMVQKMDELTQTVADLGQIIVYANDRSAGRIVDATTESVGGARLLAGGRVSQRF